MCLVLDVGTLGSRSKRWIVANAVLTHLWRERSQRRPTLVVVDEAHDICPRDPVDDLQAVSTEATVRIADEGRTFGLPLSLCRRGDSGRFTKTPCRSVTTCY